MANWPNEFQLVAPFRNLTQAVLVMADWPNEFQITLPITIVTIETNLILTPQARLLAQ